MISKKQPHRSHREAKPVEDDHVFSRERMNRASTEFLKIEVQTALTFLTIARQTQDSFRQRRNLQAARKAYNTVLKLRDRVLLSEEDSRTVSSGLERLRSELGQFGEVL